MKKRRRKDKLSTHDGLPILMLLYVMLAYSMLFAGLSNAVCLHSAFFAIDFCKCFLFHTLSWFIDTVCLFQLRYCIMHSAFNLWIFLILCSRRFIYKRAMCSREIALKNSHYYHYYYCMQ